MTEIQIFRNPLFGEVRTVKLPEGQVGFVGKDVATALGYAKADKAINQHVETDDRLRYQIGTSGQKREMIIINESGLYSLILSSKLPQAKQFKHWITNEVLPQIRQTGGYIHVNNDDDENTIMVKAHQITQKTIEKKDILLKAQLPLATELEIMQKSDEIRRTHILDENAFTDDCYTISQIAEIMQMNVKELNKRLVEEQVQFWNGGRYKLTEAYQQSGYAKDRSFHYYALDGEKKERKYLVWTQKGMEFIRTIVA
jgi:prophage antirepressor-like protein